MSASLPAGVWGNAQIEAAARRILDSGLGHGRSAIEPAVPAWTAEVAADLGHRVLGNADAGSGGFLGKLKARLDGAPRATCLLAAELLYVQGLPLTSVLPKTKRARVDTALSGLQPAADLPPELDAALDAPGVFDGGMAFDAGIWEHIAWLASLIGHWWQQPGSTRDEALRDPWAFRRVLASLPDDQPAVRSALQYLMFPTTFCPVVRADDKRAIRDAFAEEIGSATGDDAVSIDRDLAEIYALHRQRAGARS